jgi:hypothetical protein
LLNFSNIRIYKKTAGIVKGLYFNRYFTLMGEKTWALLNCKSEGMTIKKHLVDKAISEPPMRTPIFVPNGYILGLP